MDSRGGTDSANSPDNDADTETGSGEDSTRDNGGGEDGDDPPLRGNCEAAINAQIPNYEIRSLFRRWLRHSTISRTS